MEDLYESILVWLYPSQINVDKIFTLINLVGYPNNPFQVMCYIRHAQYLMQNMWGQCCCHVPGVPGISKVQVTVLVQKC